MTLNARRLIIWSAAFATMALTGAAGVWQLGRAEQKRMAEAALQARSRMPAWTNVDWPCHADAATELPVHRPARLRGHWLADRTVFLDNRPMGGMPGFTVVTPLRLSAGAPDCPSGIVLVQRGWVPRDPIDRLRLPQVETSAGEVELAGRVARGVSQVFALGTEAASGQASGAASGPVVRQNADAAFWAGWLGQAPLAGAVQQMHAATPLDAAVLRRDWAEPGQGQDKHLAYAAQWFAMAFVVAGLTIWFQIIRPRRQRRT